MESYLLDPLSSVSVQLPGTFADKPEAGFVWIQLESGIRFEGGIVFLQDLDTWPQKQRIRKVEREDLIVEINDEMLLLGAEMCIQELAKTMQA